MTATAHALVGGAIAASIPNPLIGISLSVASHPLLDMIPHWDFGRGWRQKTKLLLLAEASIDLAVGFILAYFIFAPFIQNIWYFLACVLAAEIFDLAQIPYWFLKWNFPPFSWIYKLQSKMQGKANLPWGIVTQIASVLTIMIALKSPAFH